MRRKRQQRTRKPSGDSVIALLTDFGDLDHFVGTMKGVILSLNPTARIVDICHNVDPQNIAEAGYLLWASYKYFPGGTTFVCVVDPGVGTDRKIICIETSRHTFVAPDNGLLGMLMSQEKVLSSYEITAPPSYGRTPISATFHGRDIFAPVGAHLSLGEPVKKFGKKCVLKKPTPIFYDPEGWGEEGRILHIDRFGNLMTNVPGSLVGQLAIRVGAVDVRKRVRNFAEGSDGEPCLIVGSSGLVEIVLRNGSAAKTLNASTGMRIGVFGAGKGRV